MPARTVSELPDFLTEDQLRRAIDTVIDGIILIDSSGIVLLCNSACQRLFGYSAEEVLGNNVKMLMTSRDPTRLSPMNWRSVPAPSRFTVETS